METDMETLRADVVIVGGGVGGCAAALALLETGHRVIMTDEFAWIGGQFTSQAVPPDEHGWIERFGCTQRYRMFREKVRAYYRAYYPLKDGARADPALNPGNGWVSPLCHEPRVALAVFLDWFAPFLSAQKLLLLARHVPRAVEKAGASRAGAVIAEDLSSGVRVQLVGRFFLDATENGDLLPLAQMAYVTGSEARADTGEPGAGENARPDNVQAFSMCFVLDESPIAHTGGALAPDGANGARRRIVKRPERYDFWKKYIPQLNPSWPGPLLGWQGLNPRTMQVARYNFAPHREDPGSLSGLWSYRRIVDRTLFADGFYASDLCLVNWPMIDYMEGDLLTCGETERARRIADARELSLSAAYWLQTEAPRPDGGAGWPGLRLRGDITGCGDGLAMAPYVREARRIRALYTIREQDVSAACRPGDTLAERYEDSVGVGHYRIDLHPSTGGDNYVDVASLPFRIPLGALVPVEMENVLPAAKNIGVTHITNGCYRLHPVEWNIGEAAGLLAAYCIKHGMAPQAVSRSRDRVGAFQEIIMAQGIETRWPEDLNLDDGDPHAHVRPRA